MSSAHPCIVDVVVLEPVILECELRPAREVLIEEALVTSVVTAQHVQLLKHVLEGVLAGLCDKHAAVKPVTALYGTQTHARAHTSREA